MTVFYERFRKVCPQCNTAVHPMECNRSICLRKVYPQCNTVVHEEVSGQAFALKKRKAWCTAVGEPESTMKRRKALLSEEELLLRKERDKARKVSKRASETCEQTLHRQEQNQTHMASINTYHLACTEGSALHCCSSQLHFKGKA